MLGDQVLVEDHEVLVEDHLEEPQPVYHQHILTEGQTILEFLHQYTFEEDSRFDLRSSMDFFNLINTFD